MNPPRDAALNGWPYDPERLTRPPNVAHRRPDLGELDIDMGAEVSKIYEDRLRPGPRRG
ncbi:hypothetical protein Pme01_41460 [Planosporangium mesophilum]|uniref:Uncharacterized protein n=1 Tax=Planosporangium mesophilum TaxID=689768 RepID=A0A8J3TDY9_9ACTN|nr:hypothetical protein Pme01_41460 [Planosporangium mesophilum]